MLVDVVRETKTLVVRQLSARNRLQSAASEARREEKEAEATARALDRKEPGGRAAIKAMSKALSKRRDVEQLEHELAAAEERVAEVDEFWETVTAVQEDIERTVGKLRWRYEAAERLVTPTGLGDESQLRLQGVRDSYSRGDISGPSSMIGQRAERIHLLAGFVAAIVVLTAILLWVLAGPPRQSRNGAG